MKFDLEGEVRDSNIGGVHLYFRQAVQQYHWIAQILTKIFEKNAYAKISKIIKNFEVFSYKANFIYSYFILLNLVSDKMSWSIVPSFKCQFPVFDIYYWPLNCLKQLNLYNFVQFHNDYLNL